MNNNNKVKLGERLKVLRGSKSLQEVAEGTGVPADYIERLEDDSKCYYPSTHALYKISEFYNSDLKELLILGNKIIPKPTQPGTLDTGEGKYSAADMRIAMTHMADWCRNNCNDGTGVYNESIRYLSTIKKASTVEADLDKVVWVEVEEMSQDIDGSSLTRTVKKQTTLRDLLNQPAKVKDDWISVEEDLPSKGLRVIVYVSETGSYYTAWLSENNNWVGASGRVYTGVTHWQSLPAPPKDKKQ